MPSWLQNILQDAEQKAAQRPTWAKSEYAQGEIARLREFQSQSVVACEPQPTQTVKKP